MFLSKCCGVVLTLCVFADNSMAGAPATFEQKLKEHHVALTHDGLVHALRDSDPEVRDLAAQELASEGLVDTIPSIREALEKEAIPNTKIDIAFALAQLGDAKGFETLKKGCSTGESSPPIKMRATRYLLDLGSNYCLPAEFEALQAQSDPDTRIQALALIRRFDGISQDDTRRLAGLSAQALRDETPGVRIYAGQALATLGTPEAVPHLESAIADEKDAGVRSQLELDLQQLQEKKQDR